MATSQVSYLLAQRQRILLVKEESLYGIAQIYYSSGCLNILGYWLLSLCSERDQTFGTLLKSINIPMLTTLRDAKCRTNIKRFTPPKGEVEANIGCIALINEPFQVAFS